MKELITDEVITRAQSGNNEAMELILKEYENLIFLNIKNYFLVGAEKEDLLQEGMIGLLKAINNYTKGKASFKTFAALCIRRQILTAVRSSHTQKNSILNIAIENNISDEDGAQDYEKEFFLTRKYDPEEIYLSKEKIREFRKFVDNNFSPLEKEVLNLMTNGYTYKEIALELEKTPKAIDNALQRVKKKSELWLKDY